MDIELVGAEVISSVIDGWYVVGISPDGVGVLSGIITGWDAACFGSVQPLVTSRCKHLPRSFCDPSFSEHAERGQDTH